MHYVDPNNLLIIDEGDDDTYRDLSFVEAHEVKCTYISIIPSSSISTPYAETSMSSSDSIIYTQNYVMLDWYSISKNILFYAFFTGIFALSIYLLILLFQPSN